jgi:hypothetical protein
MRLNPLKMKKHKIAIYVFECKGNIGKSPKNSGLSLLGNPIL